MGKHLRTLRGKVIALTLLVVLGTQVATVMAVLIAANRDIDNRTQEELRDGAGIFSKLVANRADILYKVAKPLSEDAAFRLALEERDTKVIGRELSERALFVDADIALATDSNGKLIASSSNMLGTTEDLRKLMAAEHTSIRFGNDVYEMISIPMTDAEDSDWISMGYVLNDTVAQKFASVTGLEMTLMMASGDDLRGISLLGSSLSRDERNIIVETSARIAAGMDPLKAADLLRSEYVSIRVPYLPDSSEVFAILQVPITEAMAPFDRLQGTMLHAASTSIIFALILAFYLSSSVTNPIHHLLIAARRMRIGNYSRKLGIDSKDEFGELARAFESMRNGIAEREKRISYQAQFDNLTGLPNRNQAMEILRSALRISAKTGNPMAVMVMHLQRFREIQSSLGHEIGDEVLRQTAHRLQLAMDDSQVLARLEGDQFMLVAPNSDRDKAKKIAFAIIAMLDKGLSVQSVNVTLDACIGICISPDHGQQPDELLRRATVAKNDALDIQRRVKVYQNGREARHVRQLAILGDLRRAVDENELQMYLQPKIDLDSSQVCGVEALLRWEHPELGNIPPQEFVPLAESAGNIYLVTEWIIDRACARIAAWQQANIELPIAINLSRRDLMNNELPALISNRLKHYDVQPSMLTLEITEEAVVADINRAIKVLEQLREMGLHISMDDFGTGYSSLGHLQKLPVDELKIDRSFVINLPDERQNAAIVRSIIELAHNLALEVVAEGVETTAALRWLRAEGCERAQGYYLGKPMSVIELERWLRSWEDLSREAEAEPGNDDSLILRPRLIT